MVHLFTLLSDVDSSFVDYYDTFPIKQYHVIYIEFKLQLNEIIDLLQLKFSVAICFGILFLRNVHATHTLY